MYEPDAVLGWQKTGTYSISPYHPLARGFTSLAFNKAGNDKIEASAALSN